MGIKVNVKRNFVVNGRTYDSVEDMPPEIREAFDRAMASTSGEASSLLTADVKTAIVFNGCEYTNPADMPEDERRLYELALKAAAGGQSVERKTFSVLPSPPAFEKSFPRRWIFVVIALAGVLLWLLLTSV